MPFKVREMWEYEVNIFILHCCYYLLQVCDFFVFTSVFPLPVPNFLLEFQFKFLIKLSRLFFPRNSTKFFVRFFPCFENCCSFNGSSLFLNCLFFSLRLQMCVYCVSFGRTPSFQQKTTMNFVDNQLTFCGTSSKTFCLKLYASSMV